VKYLCDISLLLAAQWRNHPRHADVQRWLTGRQVAVCPLTQLGFVRISSDPSGPFKATPEDAHWLLRSFANEHAAAFIPDDLSVLDSRPASARHSTDLYLGSLAHRHGLRWATLDRRAEVPGKVVV
jgi:predicted nucleic acid-binding protein